MRLCAFAALREILPTWPETWHLAPETLHKIRPRGGAVQFEAGVRFDLGQQRGGDEQFFKL